MQRFKISNLSRNFNKIRQVNAGYSTINTRKYAATISSSVKRTIFEPNLKNPVIIFNNSLTTPPVESVQIDQIGFEKACEETLESLTEYLECLIEDSDKLKSADVSYSSGVLTVNLGEEYGTYVINRQSPNRQIWLSSPVSGPKRYDFMDGTWIYKHDGVSLHRLLQDELSKIVKDVDFNRCSYSKL